MKSWLHDGEQITARFVESGEVTTAWGGDGLLFDARVGFDAERSFDASWLAGDERELVRQGARFWLVQEHAADGGSDPRVWSAIAFARPGVRSAAEAFAVDGESAGRAARLVEGGQRA